MSLILDALNRADKERSASPQTANLHPSPTPTPQQGSRIWRWILEGAVVVGLLGIVIYLVYFQRAPGAGAAVAPVTQPPVTQTPIRSARDTAPTQTATPSTPAPQTQASASSTTTAPLQPAKPVATPVPNNVTSDVATSDAEKSAAKPAENNDAIAALYKQKNSSTQQPDTAPPPAPAARPAPAAAKKPIREKPAGLDIFNQVPLLSALPERFQATVPNIEYSVHVYNEKGNSGMVNLNGAMRHIGDSIAPGLSVVAILPHGVVLDYQGTQFRLKALNSWVNFR